MRFSGLEIHGWMRQVLKKIQRWIEAGGVALQHKDDPWVLGFYPDLADRAARRAARGAVSYDDDDEDGGCVDFESDDCGWGRWRDTL